MESVQEVEEKIQVDSLVSKGRNLLKAEQTNSKEQSETAPPIPPEGWTRCHVYLPQKRRFCRQEPVRNDSRCYCGNHQHLLQQMKRPQEEMETTKDDDDGEKSQQPTRKQRSRRIPCPVDPTHWIAVDAIERHVLICPKAKEAAKRAQQSFYCQGCNAGGSGSLGEPIQDMQQPLSSHQAGNLALVILATHQRIFGGSVLSTQEIQSLTLSDIEGALELEDFSNNNDRSLTLFLDEQQKDLSIRFGGEKHMKQQASLLGHLERCAHPTNGATGDDGNAALVVEVGAGRGMMGLVAAASLAAARSKGSTNATSQDISSCGVSLNNNPLVDGPSDATQSSIMKEKQDLSTSADANKSSAQTTAMVELLMIERSGSRGKAEKFIRNFDKTQPSTQRDDDGRLRLDLVQWHRISCDLQHVRLESAFDSVETIVDKDTAQSRRGRPSSMIHVVGKHVCGVGTDLSLKALEPLCVKNGKRQSKYLIHSCIMALCCHGVCSWNDYVGRDFLREALISTSQQMIRGQGKEADLQPLLENFGRAQFECMRKWCAAAVATRGKQVSGSEAGDHQEVADGKERELENPEFSSAGEAEEHGVGEVQEHGSGNDDEYGNARETKDSAAIPTALNISDVVESLNLSCGIKGLGRACQRLFDYGRLEYMRKVLMFDKAKLVHYVPSSVTPQNAVLVANNIHRSNSTLK